MKTLSKTTFEKIKPGEVFAHTSIWAPRSELSVYVKDTTGSIIFLADNFSDYPRVAPYDRQENVVIGEYSPDRLYKLPKSVQRLWVEQ